METFMFDNNIQNYDLSGFMVKELEELARKDGRFIGNAMETLLDLKFDNLVKKDDNDYYDMDAPEGRTVEIRVVGQARQASFDSSSNVGKGRQGTNLSDTISKIEKVSDWILIDTQDFPQVRTHHVSRAKVSEYFKNSESSQRRVSFNKFKEDFYG